MWIFLPPDIRSINMNFVSCVGSITFTYNLRHFSKSAFICLFDILLFFLSLQLIENSVCLLRNLSFHVHREIPGCERYQEAAPLNQGPAPSGQKGGCFSSRKSKGLCPACTIFAQSVRGALG